MGGRGETSRGEISKRRMNTSGFEILVREYFRFHFPKNKVIYNWRPNFLRNEKTSKNFEIDIYYPELKLAIEVNGITHRLKEIKERDKFKKIRCDEVGIRLFQIKHPRELSRFYRHLKRFYKVVAIPKELRKKLYQYKPSEKSFNNLGKIVKYKIKLEKASDINREETENVRRRREIKMRLKI